MATNGNVGLLKDVRNVRGHMLLHLKLKHEVDMLADKLFSVVNSDVGILAIIEGKQLHAGRCCCLGHALRYCH
jgi:hypothetical protein